MSWHGQPSSADLGSHHPAIAVCLYVNDQVVGDGKLERVGPASVVGAFDVGADLVHQ